MKIKVTHHTVYRYSQPVSFGPHQLLLRPRENHHVSVISYHLAATPEAKICWARDHNENSLASAYFRDRADRLEIFSEMEVETLERNPFDFILEPEAARFPFRYSAGEASALQAFLTAPADKDAVVAWARDALPDHPDETLSFLTQLNACIRSEIACESRFSGEAQSPEATLRRRSGACRDLASLLMAAARTFGLAARFASGYLADPGWRQTLHSPDQADSSIEFDGGALHAWTEIYLPGAGWKGFDPSRGLLVDDRYVPVAVGRSTTNLQPIQGSFFGAPGAVTTMQARIEVKAS
jgi:transglutaminase-like putative cysteine protease